jgi:hypothetical protein
MNGGCYYFFLFALLSHHIHLSLLDFDIVSGRYNPTDELSFRFPFDKPNSSTISGIVSEAQNDRLEGMTVDLRRRYSALLKADEEKASLSVLRSVSAIG